MFISREPRSKVEDHDAATPTAVRRRPAGHRVRRLAARKDNRVLSREPAPRIRPAAPCPRRTASHFSYCPRKLRPLLRRQRRVGEIQRARQSINVIRILQFLVFLESPKTIVAEQVAELPVPLALWQGRPRVQFHPAAGARIGGEIAYAADHDFLELVDLFVRQSALAIKPEIPSGDSRPHRLHKQRLEFRMRCQKLLSVLQLLAGIVDDPGRSCGGTDGGLQPFESLLRLANPPFRASHACRERGAIPLHRRQRRLRAMRFAQFVDRSRKAQEGYSGGGQSKFCRAHKSYQTDRSCCGASRRTTNNGCGKTSRCCRHRVVRQHRGERRRGRSHATPRE